MLFFKSIIFSLVAFQFSFKLIDTTHDFISPYEHAISRLNLDYDSYNSEQIDIPDPGDDTEYDQNYFAKTHESSSAGLSANGKNFNTLCELKRFRSIYRRCNHKTRFTEREINRAKTYIQNRFLNAAIPPQKKACKTLRVRRDFKCLNHLEKLKFINAYIKLYKSGIVDVLTAAHHKYWGSAHKCAEGTSFHKWMSIVIERELLKITKDLSFPYWDNTLEFAGSEYSIIWDYLGHAGNASNNYCIPDGPFRNVKVSYPTRGCIKRQWNPNGTLQRWESPEFTTSYSQRWPTDFVGFFTQAFNQHFKKHLSIGGDNGYMSNTYAANDPVFYMYHNHQIDQYFLKWFLINEQNTIPLAFNDFQRYDYTTNQILPANIAIDRMNFFDRHTVVEPLQIGFGETCYATDQFIDIINKIMDNIPPKLPAAVDRLRQALPPNVFQYYFPRFAANNASYFEYDLPDVGNCRAQNCKRLPRVKFYNSTISGRQQYIAFKTAIGIDVSSFADTGEAIDYDFTTKMNYYNYCSPYIF